MNTDTRPESPGQAWAEFDEEMEGRFDERPYEEFCQFMESLILESFDNRFFIQPTTPCQPK